MGETSFISKGFRVSKLFDNKRSNIIFIDLIDENRLRSSYKRL